MIGSGGANDVKQTTDGGYVVTGSDYSDVFLTKTDSTGNFLWNKTYGGTYVDRGASVQQTTDGGYIISGNIYDGGTGYHYSHLIKTDANGDTLWVKTYGGTVDDRGNCVQQTADGGYIVTGISCIYNVFINPGDVSLFKTDSIGNILWAKAFSGTSVDVGYSFSPTADGGYIITGSNNDPGAGNNYVYLIKTDSSGNSGCNDTSWIPSVIPYTMQVSVPSFNNSSPLMSATSPVTIAGSGGIVNTLCTTVGLNEIAGIHSFIIFPNPTKGNFVTVFEEMIMNGKIEILNILGESLLTDNIFYESRKEINLKNISAGIYFVKVFEREKYYCKKIIVEQD
ncbi:MAG: T9SS type A sorting domain-containing protein [Bacteroidetes bacterium]|nr:T9SS type A sorting domain-containing protein [Bacteroidota bacterium]